MKIKLTRILLCGATTVAAASAFFLLQSSASTEDIELKLQYDQLKYQMTQPLKFKKVASTTYNEQSLITVEDADPLAIVLRRVNALMDYLTETGKADCSGFRKEVSALAAKANATPVDKVKERKNIYMDLCKVRRKIMFANSDINFKDILFIKREVNPRPEMEGNHMIDQFFGFHVTKHGGLFMLKNAFSANPVVEDVLKTATPDNGYYKGEKLTGGFLSPELNFEGDEIMFAFTKGERTPYVWNENTTYHIFKSKLDGSGLTQITSGATNDFDPCYLPNGRVVFISERRGGFGRCHGRPVPSFTLYSMHPDGDDITMLSPHETNEWQPSVNNDGMILFTRWDYVDRGHGQAHHPWVCYPDGRDPRDIHGNYVAKFETRANMETNLRSIPGSQKFVGITAGHHAQNYGSIIVVDPNVADDNLYAPMKRITPEQLFPETEYGTHTGEGMYATPYPLSENFFLCVYDGGGNDGSHTTWDFDYSKLNYGIYLIDAFGNRELLYRDYDISCYDPIPVMKRPVPPVIPHQTMVGLPMVNGKKQPVIPEDQLPKTADVSVIDVYNTRYPFPEGTKIKEIRIVQLLPKTTPVANDPMIGYGDQKGARQVLGTVPVAEDGSAHFDLPVGIPVYFQALDENGVAVQTMRSATWVAPGEILSCKGCHENRHSAVRTTAYPTAIKAKAAKIQPEVEGSNPFSYPRLVQPVLDAKCVACHTDCIEKREMKGIPDLRGDISLPWTTSYKSLKPYCHFYDNAEFTEAESFPKEFGSYASKLYTVLQEGHHGVKLTDEEMRRMTLWMDNNANFFGAYINTDKALAGEAVYPELY